MPTYAGLMSGTSLDGVDGVLVAFSGPAESADGRVLAHAHEPFSPALRHELLAPPSLLRARRRATAFERDVVEALEYPDPRKRRARRKKR